MYYTWLISLFRVANNFSVILCNILFFFGLFCAKSDLPSRFCHVVQVTIHVTASSNTYNYKIDKYNTLKSNKHMHFFAQIQRPQQPATTFFPGIFPGNHNFILFHRQYFIDLNNNRRSKQIHKQKLTNH